MMYEVHVSRTPGEVEPFDVIPTPAGIRTVGSLMLRTNDRAVAETVRATWEQTARRVDDRHAWIWEADG